VSWPADITEGLPGPRGDEPADLRRNIVDELADHLGCAMTRELRRTKDETEAQRNVLKRFGDPKRIAYRLWFDAMKEEHDTMRKIVWLYLPTAALLCLVDWFLLWARFYWFGFGGTTKWIYGILNFPWSVFYFWIEAKRNSWWYGTFGTRFELVLNDEIGPLLVFLLIVAMQATIFTVFILGFLKRRALNRKA
jgi:hypothetical protein